MRQLALKPTNLVRSSLSIGEAEDVRWLRLVATHDSSSPVGEWKGRGGLSSMGGERGWSLGQGRGEGGSRPREYSPFVIFGFSCCFLPFFSLIQCMIMFIYISDTHPIFSVSATRVPRTVKEEVHLTQAILIPRIKRLKTSCW